MDEELGGCGSPDRMLPLPIDTIVPDVVAALREHNALVLQAPAGAGKTTRIPPALLDAGLAGAGEIIVLQPRRIAARLAAKRVADERGEPLGETVGYQVRFEDVSGPRTRIRFVTEALLTRRLLADPSLRSVSVVVLDELHERHIHTDLALALLRRLARGSRPDLRLVVMSATIDTAPIAAFFDNCPVLRVHTRAYPVAIEHVPKHDDRPVPLQVVAALRQLLREQLDGDVLVFLQGAAEIRKTMEACEKIAQTHGLSVVALHGEMPLSEQERVLRRQDRRKVILSTNVAETSVTIDGVVAVVDAGTARVAAHAPWSGLPTLRSVPVSRASAAQRAGRAGRTAPGRCLRLYTQREHDSRPIADIPEIQRVDLTEATLLVRGLGVPDPKHLGWFEPPPSSALAAADTLLEALGAIDAQGALTDLGRRMLRFPTHPRLSRMLVEAERRGVTETTALLAALLSERNITSPRRRPLGPDSSKGRWGQQATERSDLLAASELFEHAASTGFDCQTLGWMGVDTAAARAVDRARTQLARLCVRPDRKAKTTEDDVLICVLTGYPDRIARRVRGMELMLADGGTATLSSESVVRDAPLLVAVAAEERIDAKGRHVVVHLASAVEPEWLLDLFPQQVRTTRQIEWNEQRERVEAVERLVVQRVVLDEVRSAQPRGEDVSAVLADAAVARGVRSFVRASELDSWLARVAVVRAVRPDAGIADIGEEQVLGVLRELCAGLASFEQLRSAGLMRQLYHKLTPQQAAFVDSLTPERVTFPAGRTVQVHYEAGKEPWVESWLQDFFGLVEGPTIAQGKLPLVLHLLAPNRRAVQVTRDLNGFWQRTYPAVRKELCRKYPKHFWPEDGRTATPPPARRRA